MGYRVSASNLELGDEKVVRVNRTSAVVKGGRRFSFSTMVIVGDRRGVVGYGQGKAREVPTAIEKATYAARQNLRKYPLRGDTIPHMVVGAFGASRVMLKPAAPGTGIKAGATVRAVVEELGIRNLLTKVHGSVNPTNLVKAVFDGLDQLASKKEIFELRGLPVYPDRDRPKLEPVGRDRDDRERRDKRKGGAPGGKGGGPRGGRRDGPRQAKPEVKAAQGGGAPKAEAPKADPSKAEAPKADPASKPEPKAEGKESGEAPYEYTQGDWDAAKVETKAILVAYAKLSDLIPYSDVVSEVRAIDFQAHDVRFFSMLAEVSTAEAAAGRGMLSALVIHKGGDKRPGPGFTDLAKKLGRDTSDVERCWVEEVTRVYASWVG